MRTTLLAFAIALFSIDLSAQFVAILEITEPVEGVCNAEEVYALFSMLDGQVDPVCPLSEEEILARLNSELVYLKDNPKFKSKGMIGLIINCEGELVKCKMDNRTKSEELDGQIEAVFESLGEWRAGTLYGREVDSTILYSFKIKKGKVEME